MQEGQLTQRVSQAGLHAGRVHVADAALVLGLYQNHKPHVPEGLHCHLQDRAPRCIKEPLLYRSTKQIQTEG